MRKDITSLYSFSKKYLSYIIHDIHFLQKCHVLKSGINDIKYILSYN